MANKKNTRRSDECGITILHDKVIKSVREAMPEAVTLYELAEFFRIFGDSTRIGILWALTRAEMCVCDLSALLSMHQSAVSHQLRILKQARLVKFRREGKVVYYSLNDEHIRGILDDGMVHLNEEL